MLTLQSSGDLGPDRVVERPHVLYNDDTGKYVLWLHIDDSSYGEAKAGVATSDTVCGDYTYVWVQMSIRIENKINRKNVSGSSQPLGFQSRDLNVFKGA